MPPWPVCRAAPPWGGSLWPCLSPLRVSVALSTRPACVTWPVTSYYPGVCLRASHYSAPEVANGLNPLGGCVDRPPVGSVAETICATLPHGIGPTRLHKWVVPSCSGGFCGPVYVGHPYLGGEGGVRSVPVVGCIKLTRDTRRSGAGDICFAYEIS